ncbi:MAG: hypothetical protein JW779_12405 [Candidatus Thorarchaeota archaeon]|nr:hypothetical protein [Candidatus Thorarchaeota archaeon]
MRSISAKRFSLFDTLECGQTFTWIREGEGYVNADMGQVIYVEQKGDRLYYETSSSEKVSLNRLFRLDDPLDEIQSEILRDGLMKQSIEFAPDLRIVRDPFFSCLVSFICSTCKNIPAIQMMMRNIRSELGPVYEFRGKMFHGLPAPERLAGMSLKGLEGLGLGYRAKYLKHSADVIARGDITEEALGDMTYLEAHDSLKTLSGVGDKVADCVCLFSLGFLEAFPIDVWIERTIQEHYDVFTESGKSYTKKSVAARSYFGRYGGYAQQYLYYYARSRGKGPTC